jgi:hypothetical protein
VVGFLFFTLWWDIYIVEGYYCHITFKFCTCLLSLLFVLCILFGVYGLYYVSVFVLLRCWCCIVSYYCDNVLLVLDAGRLARSQNPEGPATGHPDTDFLGFPVS